jgi:hypothetical protein
MAIKINIEKARDIWRDKIRLARASKWEELDGAWFQATEVNDTQKISEIVNKKQILRDFPNLDTIAEAESIEELREIWDTELLGDK